MVSARDKLQQNSSYSASGSQADGALPSHDGPLIASFNIIVGTVNIASSFTRFFGASRLYAVSVIARPKGRYLRWPWIKLLQLRCGIRLTSQGAVFCCCFEVTLVFALSDILRYLKQVTVGTQLCELWLGLSLWYSKSLNYYRNYFICTGWNICVGVTVYWFLFWGVGRR
jgi:hypothetical protein